MSIRGNYRFYIVISSVFVSFAFGEAVLFNLPFLQLVPPLECYKEVNGTGAFLWQDCEPEEACKSHVLMRPVQGHKYHLQNWADNFDLVCASEFETGLIGAAIFAGLLLGALVLSPLSDSIGRKPTHIIGLISFMSGRALMVFYVEYWSCVIATLLIGFGMYGRLVVSYLYCLELVDEGHSKVVATIAMTLNASCSGLVALYYIFGA